MNEKFNLLETMVFIMAMPFYLVLVVWALIVWGFQSAVDFIGGKHG